MKEKELKNSAKCCVCKKSFGHTGIAMFWTLTIEHHMINENAIRKQDGLGQMLGCSELAQIMGPDEEMTKTVFGPKTVTVCELCACKSNFILMDVIKRLS